MLNSLKCFVLGTPAPTSALTPAEQVLSVVEQGQIDRASRLAAEEQARLDAERQAKLDELSDIEAEIAAALAQKTELYARIKTTLAALVPDLAALDALEISGMAMNAKACTLQHETRSPLTSAWRDAKLPGVGRVVRNWLQRLEG